MIKLNPLTEASLKIGASAHSSLQWSDKTLFENIYTDYKAVTKGARGKVTELLNLAIQSNTESTNVQQALKKVARVAFNYVDMQVIAKFDGLEYSNIEKLVKLFKYVDKHMEDKSTELRQTIRDVYKDDMSPHRYNNDMADVIAGLKEQYKLSEVEGEYKVLEFNDMLHTVEKSVDTYSEAQIDKLMEVLQARLDVVEGQRLQVA